MGRHTVPGSGAPTPDRGFWARVAVAAVVGVLALGFVWSRVDGNDDVGTTGGSAARTPTAAVSSSPEATSPSGSTAPEATSAAPAPATPTPASPVARPPTLAFTVRYPAYITVRVPSGPTLVAKLYRAGARASFDRKVLQVVNGRPRAVRFVVNGKPRTQGPKGQTEIFTVRR